MKKHYLTLCLALSLAPAALPNDARTSTHDEERAPGVLRFTGLVKEDVVSIDGEKLSTSALMRTGFDLMIAPGTYNVSVKYADGGKTCTRRVSVQEYETVTPACSRNDRPAQGR